jgi:hypothetical protein
MSEQTVVDIEPALERRTKLRAAPFKARLENIANAELIVLGEIIAETGMRIYERRDRWKLRLLTLFIVLGLAAVTTGLVRMMQLFMS